MKQIRVIADGASRGNPGIAAVGIVIKDEKGKLISIIGEYLGDNVTNNVAEYKAIIRAIDEIVRMDIDGSDYNIEIYTDSELVVKQLSGEYSVKSEKLIGLYNIATDKMKLIRNLSLFYRERKENKVADKLANVVLDFYEFYMEHYSTHPKEVVLNQV